MRILLDTNIFISALLLPHSLPAKALIHIFNKHELIFCTHIADEIRDVINRKRPQLVETANDFLESITPIIINPSKEQCDSIINFIKDPKDVPILCAAIIGKADIIISGDKHFLTLNLKHPHIISVADFCKMENI